MQLYQNRTDKVIELGIGSTPGKAWTRYDSQPGQTVEGPGVPNYREVFERAGYTAVTSEDAANFTAEAELIAQIAAEEAEAKVKAKAEAVTPEPAKPATQDRQQKGGRRGPDRSTAG